MHVPAENNARYFDSEIIPYKNLRAYGARFQTVNFELYLERKQKSKMLLE